MPSNSTAGNTCTAENVGLFRTGDMNLSAQGTHRRELLLHDAAALKGLSPIAGRYSARILCWDGLIAAAREADPCTVIVAAPFQDDSDAGARVGELIRAAAGVIPIIAAVPFQSGYASPVQVLLDHGITDIIDTELNVTPDAILPRLRAVHGQPLKRLLEPALSRSTPVNTRTLIYAAAEVAVDRGTAVDLATIFQSTERTISGWCARASLPPPRRLLAWMRLVLALSLLESPRRSVAKAAMGAGYSFDHSLRRAVRDLLRGSAPPRERTVSEALDVFAAELRSLKEKRRAA
jgi:hypothetical protein